ncbi:MAG: shikimate dehydrogenase [Lachnospiraceae bacterium]|nr:shikimate dehydrogenase [Lachnospiraceae bacterium]
MDINGHTRVLGVIGNPVEHTMSPVIHNNLAAATGENLVYTAFHVENENVGDAVKGAYALNLLGMNVTVPHKSAVIPYLKEIDPLAGRIGAVNTLVRCEGGFKGYNTDMPGLLRAMEHDGVAIKGEEIILLGAGGVARAVAMMLADNGAAQIYILNRSLKKAEEIAREVNSYCKKSHSGSDGNNSLEPSKEGFEPVKAMGLEEFSSLPSDRKYIAIHATSVGMHPNTEEAVIEDEKFYKLVKTGYDIVFNPLETKFMKLCKAAGGESFGGLRMLLYQGIIAYELWTGKSISDNLADEVYEKMLDAMRNF